MQTISWILTACALYGTWLNANQSKNGFWWWLITDILFSMQFVSEGLYAQAFLFFVYSILAVRGLVKWK
jgi:nicotinamide mononucleotide transporter